MRVHILTIAVAVATGCGGGGGNGIPCRADCECSGPGGGGHACVDGRCATSATGPARGVSCQQYQSNWPINCVCNGGTCDDRGCCLTSEGTVAAPDAEMCRPMACHSDCECAAALPGSGGDSCESVVGECRFLGRHGEGYCLQPGQSAPPGSPFTCACTGGTCDTRGCCVQPDGTVARPYDPACVP